MFAHFGAAFYLMNCFEHGLAIALMYVEFLMEQLAKLKKDGKEKFDRTKYEDEFDVFFEIAFSQTTGNLLRRLERQLTISDQLKEDIRRAKQRRDFLAHHFFRDRAEQILTRKGLDTMIGELVCDQDLFRRVDEGLQDATASVRARLGVKDEWLENHFQHVLQQVLSKDG